jgi:adenine-specific DNA methylase
LVSIETRYDVPLIASMALKEKQIQQSYRPIIAVHKWFARRPGTLFRGLILSEFVDKPLAESFFQSNDLSARIIADPFMGGGTPLLEANRVGCDVQGFDINPMAAWIVREEIEHLDLAAYRKAADSLIAALTKQVGEGYRTDCPHYGDKDVPVKYFLWVKVLDCEKCQTEIDLFPGYLIADNTRHPANVLVCATCGELNEVVDINHLGKCSACRSTLVVSGPAKRNRCACASCKHVNVFPRKGSSPLRHRMFAIEYYNPARKADHEGRFFKKPDANDLARAKATASRWRAKRSRFVPQQEILPGDETDRLHRWGYGYYRDLFNERQLLGLELSCRLIVAQRDERIRHALATNLSDLLRYQNMLCRYDTMALKSLDIFSVHGFPVGLIQCESNLLGITNGNGANVGSGGWSNIVDKYAKAKRYCDAPFEVKHSNSKKKIVPIEGEWIGERRGKQARQVSIRCADAATLQLVPESLDAVFTDPPYFGNVQYGELMDFCYVWLRQLVSHEAEGFCQLSSRSQNELTGNQTKARGYCEFAEGLGNVYRAMAGALKPGAPLAFTFHHNRLEAYETVGIAILDAGLVCSATLPCPAEMGGSIHIHGTGSSIVDTVFVCRTQGHVREDHLFEMPEQLIAVVSWELAQLRAAGMKPTAGDIRCIVYGHLTRIAIWNLRTQWKETTSTRERLNRFRETMNSFGDAQTIIDEVVQLQHPISDVGISIPIFSQEIRDAVSF